MRNQAKIKGVGKQIGTRLNAWHLSEAEKRLLNRAIGIPEKDVLLLRERSAMGKGEDGMEEDM